MLIKLLTTERIYTLPDAMGHIGLGMVLGFCMALAVMVYVDYWRQRQ